MSVTGRRARRVALVAAIWSTTFLFHPTVVLGFFVSPPTTPLTLQRRQQPSPSSCPPLTVLAAATSGGTRKGDDTSSSSSSSSSSTPRWKQRVEAKRDFLGHVVPKTSTTRQRRKVRQQGKYSGKRPSAPPLKILGGTFRSRKLQSPEVHLRPMMGKVREACFSTLTYFDLYKPPTNTATKALCRHLDIFAGSGSVGLESLSRGATYCTFVDLAPQCCETIRANLELCNVPNHQANVICADAMEMLQDPISAIQKSGIPPSSSMSDNDDDDDLENNNNPLLLPYQIVTLCPPYEEVIYGDLIDAVCNSPLVTDDTVILIEYPIELGCLPHVYDLKSGGKMIGLRNRKYGRTVVAMYIINPTGKLEGADSRPEEFVSL